MDRVGVILCGGCGIGDAVDLDAVAAAAAAAGAAATLVHPCCCAADGLEAIRAAVAAHALDGIVVAACSERAKRQELASLGFDPAGMWRVALREHCAWSHPAGDEDTRMLAEDLVRMGLARMRGCRPIVPVAAAVSDTVLVVGGGRAGLEAARVAAGLGHPVVLVEKGEALGGRLAAQRSVVPEEPPYDRPHPNPIPGLIAEVTSCSDITVLPSTTIGAITGQPGRFAVRLDGPPATELTVGAIIQATGARPYDAHALGHLGYGASPDVITSEQLEVMLLAGAVVCPSSGAQPGRVLFIQCAGSRDDQHLRYCSSECCATTLRQAHELRAIDPKSEIVIVYRDLRAPGQLEHLFAGVQDMAGAMMARGDVDRVRVDGRLSVELSNSLLGEHAAVEADLVVLAVGMVPTAADGELIRRLHDARHQAEHAESAQARADAGRLAGELSRHQGTEILNLGYRQGPDLPALRYSFPDSHFICFPYETRRTGIYAAGTVRAPMGSAQAAEDGAGAAMKAVQCIEMAKRGEAVHPRAGDCAWPEFFLQRCTQCKRCTEECPFGTLDEDAKGTPELRELRCRRCGICMGSCPERIISFQDYSVQMVADMIKAIEVPEDLEGKPRILALMCENDAVPALDAAAANGATWNPWVRVIPIRCLGSTNVIWIAEALSRGVDGVILIGCKYGDDYQCHFIRGSELASTRLDNVGETLQRLALEPERIKLVELSHDEFDRIPLVLDEFAASLEALGPNPMKGF
ncbi:MAG TPA: hydrogenase iron-sulfur subunit [Thermoanaerobaculales bacterium]|nr:hydrogenase iron-sulfur subunit [Thermoanaerobaculales bacterium]HQN95833.1 hydrogenase iron-sulfur subunit [Thermoanaerobaculales bacterium]